MSVDFGRLPSGPMVSAAVYHKFEHLEDENAFALTFRLMANGQPFSDVTVGIKHRPQKTDKAQRCIFDGIRPRVVPFEGNDLWQTFWGAFVSASGDFGKRVTAAAVAAGLFDVSLEPSAS